MLCCWQRAAGQLLASAMATCRACGAALGLRARLPAALRPPVLQHRRRLSGGEEGRPRTPLARDGLPAADPAMKVLKNAGFKPEWVELVRPHCTDLRQPCRRMMRGVSDGELRRAREWRSALPWPRCAKGGKLLKKRRWCV